MILAFRIVKAEDRGETVKLTLAEDGIEDPKVNAVVIDTDDLPGYKSGQKTYDFAFSKQDGHYPPVMVNGVEMDLHLLQTRAVFQAGGIDEMAAMNVAIWTAQQGMTLKKRDFAKIAMAVAVHASDEIILVAAWK